MTAPASPLFTLHTDPDGLGVSWVTVDRWTPVARLSPDAVNGAGTDARIRLEGTVRITVANGEALYRITGWDQGAGVFLLELVSATGPS